jgi:deazaflavin-dependent oxidoreductase (nitroreductase family)
MNVEHRHLVPGRLDLLFNRLVSGLTRAGLSLWGSRVLRVRGRSSGEWRSVPVNLLTVDGVRYLVAPRGHVQWVRNLRAAGAGELVRGRHVERFAAEELAGPAKPAVLRAYLRRWAFEVDRFFPGLTPDATDQQWLAVADDYPVFRIR